MSFERFLLIFIAFFICLTFVSNVSASNIYVEGSNDSVGDGSSNNPYNNLKIAINKSNSGFGDIIIYMQYYGHDFQYDYKYTSWSSICNRLTGKSHRDTNITHVK
nr:hypothetical protein [Methanobrevibacter arboriphilus]